MNRHDHILIASLASQCLFPKEPVGRNCFEAAAVETCMYPDDHAIDLLKDVSGPWSEYFAPSLGRMSDPRVDRTHFRRSQLPPLRFYLGRLIRSFRDGDLEQAGRFAGVFSHILGDFTQPAHYYQTDISNLLPPPPEMANGNTHQTIEVVESSLTQVSHVPLLLGHSREEALFRFESRLAKLHRQTVAAIIPMLQEIYRQRPRSAQKILDTVVYDTIVAYVDFCHTARLLASEAPGRLRRMSDQTCVLREIEPAKYDVEYNYTHRPLVDRITLHHDGQAEAFRLKVSRGQRYEEKKVQGICTIPHALLLPGIDCSASLEYHLPRNTFTRFTAVVGLLANVPNQGRCRFLVKADGTCIFESPFFGARDPAKQIELNLDGVKTLSLTVISDGNTENLCYPLWGEPVLHKS